MITLNGKRSIAGCDVYRDDVDPLLHYVIPNAPRIAVDETGRPIFSLMRYRRPVEQLTPEERKTRLGGGLLTLSTELSVTAEQEAQIRQQLAASASVAADSLKFAPVPVKEGSVTIAVVGETAGGEGGAATNEFVSSLVGVGRVSMVGANRAAFMAKLTQDGSVLLWDMIEKNLTAIRVEYDLKYNHRLDGVRMAVWADAKKTFQALNEQWAHIKEDARWRTDGNWHSASGEKKGDVGHNLWSLATESNAARVTVVPEAGTDAVPQEQITALMTTGQGMVSEFLARALLEFKAGDPTLKEMEGLETELPAVEGKKYGSFSIDHYEMKKFDQSMEATLDVQFKTQAVLEGHLVPNDNLSNITGGRDIKEFRTEVEIDAAWYKYLDVVVNCTADFANDPVDLVKAHLSYKASGPQGTVDSVKDLVFQKDSPPQNFATYLAGPDKKSYDYEYEVFYRGSTTTMKVAGTTDETILVLDTDRLGILRVDVQAGVVDWKRFSAVIVKLAYGAGSSRKETELTLKADAQAASWVEVIGEAISQPYEYRLTFVTSEGQRLEGDLETSRSNTLVVDQPLHESLDVTLVAAGQFGEEGLLKQVVVALKYSDPANNYVVDDTFTLKSDTDGALWSVPLMDKSLRTYQFRTTVFYSDGVTREDDWQTTDKPVLAVGDPFGMRVQILPYLLKNPPGMYQFGTVHLSFEDAAAGIRAEKDLQITDFAVPLIWRFRLGAPDRHTYKYQLSLFKADGQEVKVPEKEESKEVLVLAPPAA